MIFKSLILYCLAALNKQKIKRTTTTEIVITIIIIVFLKVIYLVL